MPFLCWGSQSHVQYCRQDLCLFCYACLYLYHILRNIQDILFLLILSMIPKYDLLAIKYNKHLDTTSKVISIFKGYLNNNPIKSSIFLCLLILSLTHSRQFLSFLCTKGAFFLYVPPSPNLQLRKMKLQDTQISLHQRNK